MASVGGIMVRFWDYYSPAGRHEPNWTMTCEKCPKPCVKRRGATVAYERRHGIIEPLAFLHAWHEVEHPSKPGIASHALETPTPAAVDAFALAHADELKEVCKSAGR